MIFLWVVKVLVGMIMCGLCMPTHGMFFPSAKKELLWKRHPQELDPLRKALLKKKLSEECQLAWRSMSLKLWNKLRKMKKFFERYPVDPNGVIEGEGYAKTLLCDLCQQHFFFEGNYVDCVEYLLSRGADPNERSIDCYSEDCFGYSLFIVSPLEAVARVRVPFERVPLAEQWQAGLAQTLLNYGAKVSSLAVALAQENCNGKLMRVLEKAYEEQWAKPITPIVTLMKNNERHKDCCVWCMNS